MTPTDQRETAGRLLGWMFVGRPPSKPPGGVRVAIVLSAFVVWCSATALSWGTMPPLMTLGLFCGLLGAVLGTLGNLASYHQWRGERPGGLLRLASNLLSGGFLVLPLAHMVMTGQWGWLWWAVFVLTLTTVVFVAGYFYGPDGGPRPEDGPPEGRNPSN